MDEQTKEKLLELVENFASIGGYELEMAEKTVTAEEKAVHRGAAAAFTYAAKAVVEDVLGLDLEEHVLNILKNAGEDVIEDLKNGKLTEEEVDAVKTDDLLQKILAGGNIGKDDLN